MTSKHNEILDMPDVRHFVGYGDESVALARAAERRLARRHGVRVEPPPTRQSPAASVRFQLGDLLIATGHRIAGTSLRFGSGEAAAGAASRIVDVEPEGSAVR